jgi:mycothiol synthase
MVPPAARIVTGRAALKDTAPAYHAYDACVEPSLQIRAPEAGDLEAVLDVVVARDIADLGEPDYTLEDLRHDWEEPEIDLARDAWVALADGGPIAGYALLRGEEAMVLVHPDHEGRGIGRALHDRLVERAREVGARTLRQEASADNAGTRALLEAAGWRATERYWRMRLELPDAPAAPEWPPGVAAAAFVPGEDDAPVHALIEEAFAEIPGNVARSLPEWQAWTRRPGFEPGLSTVVREGGELVGAAMCWRWPDGTGFVGQLAVPRAHRGRGLGRTLLQASFAAFGAGGLTAAVLGVHAANRAGVSLYESVGMRPVFVVDRFELPLAA